MSPIMILYTNITNVIDHSFYSICIDNSMKIIILTITTTVIKSAKYNI